MPPSTPFIDRSSGTLDTDQILEEAIPLAKLIGLVVVVAAIPFAIAFAVGVFQMLFTVLTQFLLAIGSGIVLLYIITRAIQLAEE